MASDTTPAATSQMSGELCPEVVCGVRAGDTDQVKAALQAGASLLDAVLPPDDPDGPGATLMTLAAGKGHAHMVTFLLQAGLHADAQGHFPYTPLQVAAHRGHHLAMTALLAGKPHLNASDQDGVTPLHLAARRGWVACAKVLIKAGANVDARDTALRTPLHHSVLSDSTSVMRLLLDAGCDSSALTNVSFTAMHVAAIAGNERAIQELSALGLSSEERDSTGLTPEEVAEAWGRHNTAWLIRKMPRIGYTPTPTCTLTLVRRSWKDYESEGVKTLKWVKEENNPFLEANVPENRDGHYQDDNGWTPLHWAAYLGLTKIARTLVWLCGALSWALTYTRETPADLAQQAGHNDLAEWLHSSSELETTKSGAELYHSLLTVISGGDDVVEASQLLMQGAPLLPVAHFYTTALVLAITCNRPKIVSLLMAAGAPLTTSVGGLSLLQVAWTSPDVTVRVKIQVTRHFLHVLQAERRQVRPEDSDMHTGIDQVLESLRGETPRLACWPLQPQANLTNLMVVAAINNCPVTASFLKHAGAKAFLQDASGRTPLHAALKAQHWDFTKLMVRDLGGCLYMPDSRKRIPISFLPKDVRREAEESTYHRERRQLEDILQNIKDMEEKQKVQEVIDIHDYLFNLHSSQSKTPSLLLYPATLPFALMLAVQRGLLHFTYLLVTVASLGVDTVVDPTHDSCTLHEAASHGNSGCVTLLLALGALPLQKDRYGHTAAHLAAMFGHKSTYDQLEVLNYDQELECRAGTTPTEINCNFRDYLQRYGKQSIDPQKHTICNDPSTGIQTILSSFDLNTFLTKLHEITVDFSQDEAKEVKQVMLEEIQRIVDKVSRVNELYKGQLIIVGSTSDGTRLYAPDEYDMNLVLPDVPGITVEVVEQDETQAALSGHGFQVKVVSDHPSLQGNTLIKVFSELVRTCLETHITLDARLSLVPPGITCTQAGVALAFAWQGREYPLLLIGVDLVPVLSVHWPPKVYRPPLTPPDVTQVYFSNVGDGEWRCSFAAAEADILSGLDTEERRVYLIFKALLSTLKAEPWMPREVKANFTWWDSRSWKIMTPAGFAMKNIFLRQLQRKRDEQLEWKDNNVKQTVIELLRDMCKDFLDPVTGVESLVPDKISPYFGGEFERPKIGEGAPEIIKMLEKIW